MDRKKIIVKLPKNFFTRVRPIKKEPDSPEDMVPFEWPEEVLSGKYKGKVILTCPDK